MGPTSGGVVQGSVLAMPTSCMVSPATSAEATRRLTRGTHRSQGVKGKPSTVQPLAHDC